MNVAKILVPIDYSAHSDRALEWGASLAEKYGARLLLLRVISRASEDLPEAAETPLPLALDNPSVYYTRRPLASEGVTALDLIEVARNGLKLTSPSPQDQSVERPL